MKIAVMTFFKYFTNIIGIMMCCIGGSLLIYDLSGHEDYWIMLYLNNLALNVFSTSCIIVGLILCIISSLIGLCLKH